MAEFLVFLINGGVNNWELFRQKNNQFQFLCLLRIIKTSPIMRLFIGMVGAAHQSFGGHYIFISYRRAQRIFRL